MPANPCRPTHTGQPVGLTLRNRCEKLATRAPTPASPRRQDQMAQHPGAGTARVLPAQNDILRGILFMGLAVSMFPFINASAKYLSAFYPVTEIVWARFTGHLIMMVIAFYPRLGWPLFATARPVMQIARSMLLLASTAFFVSAIGQIPLATASAVGFASPFIVTALSVPVLGERVGIRRWSAVLVGFVGVLIVIRPGPGFANWAVLLVLASTSCYAIYPVITRLITHQDRPETGLVSAPLV